MTTSAMAQAPSVTANGIVNVSSYAYADLPGGAIAQGSIFGIFGTNLGPAQFAQATTYPLPTTLGGTSVKVTSGSTTAQAVLFLVSSGQINALLPSSIAAGNATLTVTTAGGTSAAASFKVVANSFGTFSLNSGGSGPGAITDPQGHIYGVSASANPGDVAIIYGTGLGPVQGNEAGGALPGDQPNLPIEVWVGNTKANVSYRGRSGCCAGLDQISFTVTSATGCRVPVVIKINNVVSNTTTLAVAPKGTRTCSDPGGPSAADLAKFQAQGGASVGAVILGRATQSLSGLPSIPGVSLPSTFSADIGAATFSKYTALQLDTSNNPFNSYTAGACSVSYTKGSNSSADPAFPKTLDAGSAITVSGPKGTRTIAKTTVGGVTSYSALFTDPAQILSGGGASYLDPGSYTITGPGGPDVGAFSGQMTLPTALKWTNQTAITDVNRANGQQVTWTGGDANSLVLITGYSQGSTAANATGATFTCFANTADGQFTIPSYVLLAMPPSVVVSGVSTGGLLVGSSSIPKAFTAVGLDVGYLINTSTSLQTVNYK
jgi:uncharacterized protein (TIGR03437 family)